MSATKCSNCFGSMNISQITATQTANITTTTAPMINLPTMETQREVSAYRNLTVTVSS